MTSNGKEAAGNVGIYTQQQRKEQRDCADHGNEVWRGSTPGAGVTGQRSANGF
jgi:hypothetical protein